MVVIRGSGLWLYAAQPKLSLCACVINVQKLVCAGNFLPETAKENVA